MSGPIVLALRGLMALALYGFLGWALFLFWGEIKRQGTNLSIRRVPGINLLINSGEGNQSARNFSQPEVIIGRDPGCDIPLTNDTVSTRHTQLSYHHNQWWVMDLASTNGTFLNGAQVKMPIVLASGDEIKCGGALITINFSSGVFVSPTQRLDKSNE
jgi:pSer/pThr/pTyr-binding forkhead associated (FHA) protein